jgi:ATP-grasp domain
MGIAAHGVVSEPTEHHFKRGAGRFARGAVPLETWHDVDITAGRAKLMENVAREIIKALQISGFVSFDFMTTEHSVVLIECNSRLMGTPFRNDGGLVASGMYAY